MDSGELFGCKKMVVLPSCYSLSNMLCSGPGTCGKLCGRAWLGREVRRGIEDGRLKMEFGVDRCQE